MIKCHRKGSEIKEKRRLKNDLGSDENMGKTRSESMDKVDEKMGKKELTNGKKEMKKCKKRRLKNERRSDEEKRLFQCDQNQ